MITEQELAEAYCVTSHHGLTRTAWPCLYHLERARAALNELQKMSKRKNQHNET